MKLGELSLGFKGDRDYVHGTSLYDCLSENIESSDNNYFISKMVLKRKVSNIPSLAESPKNSFGMVFFCDENENILKRYLNETNIPITERREFKEEIIVDSAGFTHDQIKCSFNPIFSTIEHLIAVNKGFNNLHFASSKGKWLFGRIILNKKLPRTFEVLNMQLLKSVHGMYTVCEIKIDSEYFGEMHFVLEVK